MNISADDTAIELVRRNCSAVSNTDHHIAVNGGVKKNLLTFPSKYLMDCLQEIVEMIPLRILVFVLTELRT